jgi:hypothetical protein
MGSHGYPLGKLQISLQKPNAQRQDAYRLKAHATMTSKESRNENLHEPISGIFTKNAWVPIAML